MTRPHGAGRLPSGVSNQMTGKGGAFNASEPIPFDPMELTLHNAYANLMMSDERLHYKMIHEYPLSGKPPMMTHLFQNDSGRRIIAAKGAPEALTNVSE